MASRYSLSDSKYYLTTLVLTVLYFISGKVSMLLLNGHHIVNVGIFASEGVALAFALYFGKNIWVGVFLGQLILLLSENVSILPSVGIAVVNSIEVIIAVLLFHRYKLNIELKSFRDIIGLTVIVVAVLQVFSSLSSNLILLLSNMIDSNDFLVSLFSWWFGNVTGQLLFTPFILLLLINYKTINIKEYLIFAFAFALLLYVVEILFEVKSLILLLSLSVSVIVYTVSKKSILCGMFLNIIIAMVSAYSVYLGKGAFCTSIQLDNAVDYNLFVLAHVVVAFVTSIVFQRQKELEKNLNKRIEEEIAKNKEQQLLMMQQSRLAQMGEMIAMIAHQWRQPLNNLALANQLLISRYKKNKLDDETVDYFKENSKKQISLMSSTIDDFRNFFKSEKNRENFCVNGVIDNILDMTKAIYTTSGIKIDFQAEKSYYCFGYPNDLGQVILNIINNAKDALVESENRDKKININITKQDSGEIQINIADNAGGIPESIMGKIFDPYFTTKDSKNGTGLGLYMTKMIVQEKLNAQISVKNENGGANFKILLKGDKNSAK